MDAKTIFYRVIDHCEDSYYPLKINWDPAIKPEYIAQDAAEDYFHNHDGWESSWPLTISLHDADGEKERARMVVDMESTPTFSVSEIIRVDGGLS